MSKSYVTMQQEVCLVCAKAFDTGAILMDRRMRDTFEHKTVTGWGLCPDCKSKHDGGYVALVAVDEDLSTPGPDGKLTAEGAHRTGAVAHIRREVWPKIFDAPVPDGPLCFMEPGVLTALEAMMEGAQEPG